MSLEAQINYLTAEISELRSTMSALIVAVQGLTHHAAREVEHVRQAPFIEVIRPDDPRYAEEVKSFHQDSIFEPRLTSFAQLQSSENNVQDQGAKTQHGKPVKKQLSLTRKKVRRDVGLPRPNYPRTTYSKCCGAERRKRSKHDGKCVECR